MNKINKLEDIDFESIFRAPQRDSNQGLGTTSSATPEAGDNEYDAYRKRMMLAYRFRPNPLVNSFTFENDLRNDKLTYLVFPPIYTLFSE